MLHQAAAGRGEVLQAPIDAKADLTPKTKRGETALSIAELMKQNEIAEMLQKAGAP